MFFAVDLFGIWKECSQHGWASSAHAKTHVEQRKHRYSLHKCRAMRSARRSCSLLICVRDMVVSGAVFGLLLLFLSCAELEDMPGKARREEQRVVIKFLCASGKTPAECHKQLSDVYGPDSMSKAQVGVWHWRFCGGDTSVKDKARSGRPATTNTAANRAEIRAKLDEDRRSSVRSLSDSTGVNRTTVHKVIKKTFSMSKVAPKFVPRVLTPQMKKSRMDMCAQNLELFREDPALLSKVVTGDESYFPVFDVETKIATMQWKTPQEPRPKKALRNRSEKKSMLTCFFDEKGSTLAEFRPTGDAVTAENYVALFKRLMERLCRKHPDLWERTDPEDSTSDRTLYLHHDNASPHTAVPTLAFLGESGLRMLAHPPYSLDLAPCDYFLFPYLKKQLRGTRFRNVPDLQKAVLELLKKTPKDTFQQAILQLPVRWKKCLLASGEYFEGDHIGANLEVVEMDVSQDEEETENFDSDSS